MNTTKINEIAEAADLLTARAANLAVMNALTDQQKADFTENVGDNDTVTAAISLGGNSARLVDDEWRRAIGGGNPAASEYVRGLETPRTTSTRTPPTAPNSGTAQTPKAKNRSAPSTTPMAASVKPATCTRSPHSTWRSSSPPTKRNTGRLASKRVASGKPQHARGLPARPMRARHKKNKHPPGNTNPGGRLFPTTHAIHPSVENPPSIARRGKEEKR